jgi:chromosomal replication initiation ATPase DnaA
MNNQIPLDFELTPDYSPDAYLFGACNDEARLRLAKTEDWPNISLALVGPKGSGKTHLASIWAGQNDAVHLDGCEDIALHKNWEGRYLWIDNAAQADEFILFALINLALTGKVKALLLSDRDKPSLWPVDIPDLKSRLNNLQFVSLQEVDDGLLSEIINKMFLDKGLRVNSNVVDYLLIHAERSVDALRLLIEHIDRYAAREKLNVTRALVAGFLKRDNLP